MFRIDHVDDFDVVSLGRGNYGRHIVAEKNPIDRRRPPAIVIGLRICIPLKKSRCRNRSGDLRLSLAELDF